MVDSSSLGTTIVERIADRESVDPLELDQCLYDVIDIDALDQLVHSANGDGPGSDVTVSFTFHGYAVTVDGGDVNISDAEPIPGVDSPPDSTTDRADRRENCS